MTEKENALVDIISDTLESVERISDHLDAVATVWCEQNKVDVFIDGGDALSREYLNVRTIEMARLLGLTIATQCIGPEV